MSLEELNGVDLAFGITITEEDIRKYRELSGDDSPIHSDDELAIKATASRGWDWKGKVVPGGLILIKITGIAVETMKQYGAIPVITRFRNVHFSQPLYPGIPCTIKVKFKFIKGSLPGFEIEFEVRQEAYGILMLPVTGSGIGPLLFYP